MDNERTKKKQRRKKPCVNLLFGGETSLLVSLWPPAARDQAASKPVVSPNSVPDAAGTHGAMHSQRMRSAFG